MADDLELSAHAARTHADVWIAEGSECRRAVGVISPGREARPHRGVVTATLGAPLVDVVGLERLELGRAEDVVEAVAEAVRIAHDRSRRA